MARQDRKRPLRPDVWQRLQLIRLECGWGDLLDNEFADRLGVSRQSYSNWKRGENHIGFGSLMSIGRRTGYRVEWIQSGELPKKEMPASDAELAAYREGWREAMLAVRDLLQQMEEVEFAAETLGISPEHVERRLRQMRHTVGALPRVPPDLPLTPDEDVAE